MKITMAAIMGMFVLLNMSTALALDIEDKYVVSKTLTSVRISNLNKIEITSEPNKQFTKWLNYKAILSVEVEGNVCGKDPSTIAVYEKEGQINIVIDVAGAKRDCNFYSAPAEISVPLNGLIAKGKTKSFTLQEGQIAFAIELIADDQTVKATFKQVK